jgi:hypothetical protein
MILLSLINHGILAFSPRNPCALEKTWKEVKLLVTNREGRVRSG